MVVNIGANVNDVVDLFGGRTGEPFCTGCGAVGAVEEEANIDIVIIANNNSEEI